MIEELYEQYHSELVKWCLEMTRNQHTADELVQEAFLRAMLHADLLSRLGERQRRAWLYRTTKNLYIDQFRKNSREIATSDFPDRYTESDEYAQIEWKNLLELLPGTEGRVFAMRYLNGYTSRQIGERLSLPPGTVRFKLSSARKHLKEMIGGNQNDGKGKSNADN